MKNLFILASRTRSGQTGLDSLVGTSGNLRFLIATPLLIRNLITSRVCGIHAAATEVEIVSVCARLSPRTRENVTKWEFTSDGDQLELVVSSGMWLFQETIFNSKFY